MTDSLFDNPSFNDLLSDLNALTGDLETGEIEWPEQQFDRLAETGVLGWVIPREFGGTAIELRELAEGYVRLGSACVTTAFILTQRNAAVQRIAGSENLEPKVELLPSLCGAGTFATVGISHLTTSRQHLKQPAMRVEQRGGQWVFNGTAPWVTGAKYADYLVTGGTCDDGRQILAVVPTSLDGVSILPAPRLMALNESQTGSVELRDVALDPRWLLAGPVDGVMQQGQGGTGSVTTSALAVGAAKGTLDRLRIETERRSNLESIFGPLADEHKNLHDDLLAACSPEVHESKLSAAAIRSRANSLVLRVAHAYLTASKGAGFVEGHPAGRAVREATFFLVWSCPQPVQSAALREFACVVESNT